MACGLFSTAKLMAVGSTAIVMTMNRKGITGPPESVSMKPMFR
jgi:hypothetical protein